MYIYQAYLLGMCILKFIFIKCYNIRKFKKQLANNSERLKKEIHIADRFHSVLKTTASLCTNERIVINTGVNIRKLNKQLYV